MAFIGRNSKEIRYPEIKTTAELLKKKYKKVGAIGFCYGKCCIFFLCGDMKEGKNWIDRTVIPFSPCSESTPREEEKEEPLSPHLSKVPSHRQEESTSNHSFPHQQAAGPSSASAQKATT